MGRKTTSRQVAAAAGVSPATVDRVLNGRGGVSPDKERRVFDWARELGLDRNLRHKPRRLLRIGVVMGRLTDPFFDTLRGAFVRSNNVFQSANIQSFVSSTDMMAPEAIVKLVREAAATSDALVVVTSPHPMIEAALCELARSKPLVTMVTDLPAVPRLAYVGLDNLASGRVAGDVMGRLIGTRGGTVAMVTDDARMVALKEREAGFRQVLAERHPACRLVAVVDMTGRAADAGVLVGAEIDRHQALAGIYAASRGSESIAEELVARGLTQSTIVITHELTTRRRILLREGVIDAVIDQNPELEALTAIETIAHHFGRLASPPTRYHTPCTLYLRENC